MSLINKVLKDLETRSRVADDGAENRGLLLEDLRVAPERPAAKVSWARAPVIGALVIFVMAAAVIGHRYMGSSALSPAPTVAMAPAVTHPLLASAVPSVAAPPAAQPVIVVPHVPAARHAFVFSAHKAVMHKASMVSVVMPAPKVAKRPAVLRRSPPLGAGRIIRRPAVLTQAQESRARYQRAVGDLQRGLSSRAQHNLKVALTLRPGALQPRLLLAGLEVQGGALRPAQLLLTQGLGLNPQALPVALLLAQVDLRLGEPQSAVILLAKLPPEVARSESYWALLAAARMGAGDTHAAVTTYQTALRSFAHDGPLWVGLGLAEMSEGRDKAARKAFTQAQRLPLSPVLAHFVQQKLVTLR